VSDANSMTFF